jgi:hypothetical protein
VGQEPYFWVSFRWLLTALDARWVESLGHGRLNKSGAREVGQAQQVRVAFAWTAGQKPALHLHGQQGRRAAANHRRWGKDLDRGAGGHASEQGASEPGHALQACSPSPRPRRTRQDQSRGREKVVVELGGDSPARTPGSGKLETRPRPHDNSRCITLLLIMSTASIS